MIAGAQGNRSLSGYLGTDTRCTPAFDLELASKRAVSQDFPSGMTTQTINDIQLLQQM
jgi:hypothetical protein